MMRKLLEAMTKFAGEPEQKPGEQWKGTDKGTPGKKLVGDSIIKDLSKGVTPKTKEEELAEAFANFNEDDLGVEEKRPGRKSDRPSREYTKNGKPSKRYTPVKEGWMNGSDRVNLPDGPMTYWNGTGRLQNEYNELYEKLVPSQGAAETIEGEVLRASSKIVYRHFNDGDLFNQASFDQLKQYIGTVTDYDDLAEKAIEFALKAQGNYHPNTGWDSLDAMDYGPTDDNDGWDEDDEYDDEDDTNWDEEDDELEESSDVVARYADNRARGTGFVYNVDATGQITSSGNIRHNKKFSTPEKAMAYLDKCGFTKKGELEEGMEEFAKSQAKKRAEKRKSIPWPKEVPSDAEQERNLTRDEEENDPHPYTQVSEGEHDAEFIDHEDNWYNMADWARAEFKKGKSVEEVIKYLRDNDYLGPRDINNFMKTVSGEKWNESVEQGVNEGVDDVYSITSERNGRERSKSGTLAELIEYYGYTLETGKSYEHARGNRKINLNPKNIESLVQNLNNAKSNAAANGQSNERFYVDHGNMAEGKHFKTAYGWAGGRNEKTGKMYKHPDQIKADREAKKAVAKDAMNNMFGGAAEDLTQNLKIKEADMFKAGQRAIKNIKSTTQQRKSEAEKMAIAQAQIDADRENERDRFSQEELYPSDDSHDLDEDDVSKPVNYTLGNTPDPEYIYSIFRDGKKEGTYHSLEQAKRIVANMKKTKGIPVDYKIKRSQRNKLAGPKGALPEANLSANEGWEADLAKSNRERMKKERAAATPAKPIAKAKPNYDRVFQDINSAIGDTFPDGDPMDALMRKYRDSYGDLNIDLLNKACRVNGAKSYHDYVAKVWQQHMQDNPDLVQGGNPWVAEGEVSTRKYEMMLRNGQVKKFVAKDDADAKRIAAGHGAKSVIRMKGNVPGNKIAENDHSQHYVDRYNKDLERKIDKDFDPDYDRSMSDQEFQAKLKQRGKERDQSRINLDEEEIPDQSGIYITGQQGEYIDGPFDDLRLVRHEWDLHPEYYKIAHKEELTHEEAWERFGIVEGLGNLKNIGDLVKQSHDKIRASIQSKVGMTQDQINDAGAKKIKAKWKNIGDEIIKSRLGEAPQGVAEGLVKDIKRLATGKDVKSRAGQEIAKSQDASMKGDTKTSKKHFDRYDKLDKLANKGQGVAEGQEDDGIYIGAKVYHRSHQTAEPFEVIQIIDDQRVRVIDDFGNKAVVLISELVPATVSEGWESGPEERTTRERDPDAEYDARRQEKLDAEADKAPKTTTYQCVGRGPNDEPNYKFGPEHNTSEEAVAYRKKLMANPKTPNPRDIGIRTISKVAKGINEDVTSTDPLEGALLDAIHELIGQGHTDVDPMVLTNMVVAATSRPFLLKDLVDANNNSQAVQHYIDSISPSKVKFSSDMLTVKNEDPAKDKAKAQAGVSSMASRAANRNRLGEGTETPLQNKEDYNAKRKALQDIQLDPDTAKDPQLKAEVIRRLASLNQQYSMLREQISKFKESRGHKVIATKLGNMDRMQNVQVPSPAERQEQLRIAKEKEQAGKKQVKEFAAPGMNPATPVATNTAAKPDPATVAKAAAATNTLKAATGTVVAPATLDKALDSATQGTATSTDVKALAPIMGVVNKAASDPKLAAQFKNLANQAKTTP